MAKRKRTVSSWKDKKFYTVLAPEAFDKKEVGDTLASDPEMLKGRTVNTSLGEITGDRSKNYMNLVFEIADVKAQNALTTFKKFFIPTGFLRSKVRKRTSKIDYLKDVSFADAKLRVKIMVLSRNSLSDIQKTNIKEHIDKILESHIGDSHDKILEMTLYGKLGTAIYKDVKTVTPVNRVEVHHLEVL